MAPLLLGFLLILVPLPAAADIYRYLDAEGVECFTDTPPSRAALRLYREGQQPAEAAPGRQIPAHLARMVPDRGRTATPLPSAAIAAVPPVSGTVTSTVGFRLDPFDRVPRLHQGIDIAVPAGTPVRPVAPGDVVFSGRRPGYGKVVVVEHDDGTLSLYAHNSVNQVAPGDRVEPATVIALSGSTGRSTGPHLHFEAWRDGVNVTSELLPAAAATGSFTSLGGPAPLDTIHSSVTPDGTPHYTNLPQ
jgi:murein DD-endopeptidase MepM/ murein hydrolase activator NlpD